MNTMFWFDACFFCQGHCHFMSYEIVETFLIFTLVERFDSRKALFYFRLALAIFLAERNFSPSQGSIYFSL